MEPIVAACVAVVSVLVGVLVVRAHQRLVGWLLVVHGFCFGVLLAHPVASTDGAGLVVDQLMAGSWVLLFLWLVLVAYVVPDGHPLTPRWSAWIRIGLVGVAAFLVGAADDADAFRSQHAGTDPPLPALPAHASTVVGLPGLVLTLALFFGAAFAVRARLRTASGKTRLQLLWLVWGATSLPVALVVAWLSYFLLDDDPVVSGIALGLAGLGLPVAIGVAILRHRLFDVRVVLSRTLTYGVLLGAVAALYALLLFVADRLFGASTVGGLLAVAIVAITVQPAYTLLRRRIERWVYGYRSDPATALRRLGASVESADPLHVVETITACVADAVKIDSVRVEPPGAATTDDPRTIRVPLVHRGEHVGALALDVPAGRTLAAADLALLDDLARQAAVTVRAAHLAAELQASRSRLVTAREEERRRLRRDLHDGVGPALAAILLMIQAAQSRRDETERAALLTEIGEETKAAISEVRRVVDDLRPPAIDEVGLLGAIRQRAASLSTDRLTYDVRGPEPLPVLPAAVEVAAYRIASEAMTNVAKHSGATRCAVDIELDGNLGLSVCDNGRAASAPPESGVGWTSMSERAAELGGSCTISGRGEGGLMVRAVLPLVETPDGQGAR